MATVKLPLNPELEADDFAIELDGEVWRFRFTWNQRMASWAMDLLREDETKILSGVRVATNYPILERYRSLDVPPGDLVVVDISGTGEPPGRYDLGSRVEIHYREAG